MKKLKLMAWLVATVALFGLGGGVTLAMFTGSASNSSNEFTAGTLVLDSNRDQGDSIPGPLFYSTGEEGQTPDGAEGLIPDGVWAPGDEKHKILQIENTGSLDGWLTGARATLQSGSRFLADKLEVRITVSDDSGNHTTVASGTLGQFIDGDRDFVPAISLETGEIANIHFWVKLPLDASNEYNNLTAVVGFEVQARQKRNNP